MPFHLVQSQEDFAEKMNNAGSKPVIIDFTLITCPPCQKLKPILNEIADAHEDKAIFLMVEASTLPLLK